MKKYMLLCLIIAAAGFSLWGQSSFQSGSPLVLGDTGNFFAKPVYHQQDKPVDPDTVHAYFKYDFQTTREMMERVDRLDNSIMVTGIGGTVLGIGGMATLIVAASGVADDGTLPVTLTSVGLSLGATCSWLLNLRFTNDRAKLLKEAVVLYNRSLK